MSEHERRHEDRRHADNQSTREWVARLEGRLDGHRDLSDERHNTTKTDLRTLRETVEEGFSELRKDIVSGRLQIAAVCAIASGAGAVALTWLSQYFGGH